MEAQKTTKVIDPSTFEGSLKGSDELIIREKGDIENRSAMTLHGFDEVGLFDNDYRDPEYAILSEIAIR